MTVFLYGAYITLIFQIGLIVLTVLPFPNRMKKTIAEFIVKMGSNGFVKVFFYMLVGVMFLLFVDNLRTEYKYEAMKHEIDRAVATSATVGGKHETLMNLFRAQRNVYLTFMANFNWFVLYGFYMFIKKIHLLETQNTSTQSKKAKEDHSTDQYMSAKECPVDDLNNSVDNEKVKTS